MKNTTAQEIFDSFESSFRDKTVIPLELEIIWLKKAIGRYSLELEPIAQLDPQLLEFDGHLSQSVINTLAAFMRQFYQERETSRVNKQVSIVGKDISVDGAGHTKTAARNELYYCKDESEQLIHYQKPTAYS